MARQFNLIPPVCEQAEYHYFQRDKVEVQLPELYHKIGQSQYHVTRVIVDCPARSSKHVLSLYSTPVKSLITPGSLMSGPA